MPRLSRWFIRAALLYLALGFTLGGLMLFQKGVPLQASLWRLLPLHIECLLFGWTAQLAMGVAFWILPRFGGGASRGHAWAAWLAFGLLNAGVWLVGLAPLLDAPPPYRPAETGLIPLIGRVAETLAAIAFAVHAWPRVKPMRRAA